MNKAYESNVKSCIWLKAKSKNTVVFNPYLHYLTKRSFGMVIPIRPFMKQNKPFFFKLEVFIICACRPLYLYIKFKVFLQHWQILSNCGFGYESFLKQDKLKDKDTLTHLRYHIHTQKGKEFWIPCRIRLDLTMLWHESTILQWLRRIDWTVSDSWSSKSLRIVTLIRCHPCRGG